MRGPKCASRENCSPTGETVFVHSAQTVDASRENAFAYDEWASGGLLGGFNTYVYVLNQPTRYADPLGLNPVGGAITGAEVGSAFGPVGTVVGGLVGAAAGAWIGWNVVGPIFAENKAGDKANDPVVYPDNPDNPGSSKFRPINGTPGKQCDDGSVWERDKSGHGNRDGDGSQWKRWPNRGSWERGDTPNSIWPDGRVRK